MILKNMMSLTRKMHLFPPSLNGEIIITQLKIIIRFNPIYRKMRKNTKRHPNKNGAIIFDLN